MNIDEKIQRINEMSEVKSTSSEGLFKEYKTLIVKLVPNLDNETAKNAISNIKIIFGAVDTKEDYIYDEKYWKVSMNYTAVNKKEKNYLFNICVFLILAGLTAMLYYDNKNF